MNLFVLPNGVRLLIIPYHNPKVSYCSLNIDVGSADEKRGEEGCAHFLEHMMFKGTAKRKSLQILNQVDNTGGELNAFTSRDKICIHASILSSELYTTIDLIYDIAFNSIFPKEEIEKEKKVVFDEINMYLDNPEECIYDDFLAHLFVDNGIGKSVLGTKNQVKNITQNKLKIFVKGNFNTHNIVFTVITALSTEKLKEYIFNLTGSLKPLKFVSEKKFNKINFPDFDITKKMGFSQAHLMAGFPIPKTKKWRERFVLNLLSFYLGGPFMNSRLNLSIREKYGYCYSVFSSIHFFRNMGLFTINLTTDPVNLEKALQIAKRELNLLCSKKLSIARLKILKKQISGIIQLSNDIPSDMVTSIGNTVLNYGKVLTSAELAELYDSITSEELLSTAKKYLSPSQLKYMKYIPHED